MQQIPCPRHEKPKFAVAFLAIALSVFLSGYAYAADTTAPTTSATRSPNTPNGWNSWYNTPITVTLHPNDLESGVKEVNYRVNNGVWQKQTFENTLNLLQNPSFEVSDGSSGTGALYWEPANTNALAVYSQDPTTSYPTSPINSAKIVASDTGTTWYAVANKTQFIPTTPFDNMNAYVWVKTNGATNGVYYKVYMVLRDAGGNITYSLVDQSSRVVGTVDWTKLSSMFIVSDTTAIGVYMEIGIEGTGTVWIDNAYVSSSSLQPEATVILATDVASGRLEYYSVDNAGNTETYSCSSPVRNCFTYKMDQTPPGNWNDSGAFRGLIGSAHELYVYTNVEDAMSGISTFTDKYQYLTELNTGFGRFPNIGSCSGTWQPNTNVFLISPPFFPGVSSAYLLTPKTDFCNSNWRSCKIVRFISQDMAGNTGTKDFCINGPWIKISGEGITRANNSINMLSEAPNYNTDAIIESSGNSVDFFSSSNDWVIRNAPTQQGKSYADYQSLTSAKTIVSSLQATSGVYQINGDFTATNSGMNGSFKTGNNKQIYFINGNLTIDSNVDVSNSSAVMFIVSGNVRIDKNVTSIEAAIVADGNMQTAYNLSEGEPSATLVLNGVFSANKFEFQRTLQGTNNSTDPSEEFHYEPRFLVDLKQYFDGGYSVVWR